MVEMGKECGFQSNFDMSRPFTPRKMELPRKAEFEPIKSPNGLSHPRVAVEQRTHSGDEIGLIKLLKISTQNFQRHRTFLCVNQINQETLY